MKINAKKRVYWESQQLCIVEVNITRKKERFVESGWLGSTCVALRQLNMFR